MAEEGEAYWQDYSPADLVEAEEERRAMVVTRRLRGVGILSGEERERVLRWLSKVREDWEMKILEFSSERSR